ncbi:endonuclease/exonuclease/phosphatase family protein [Colwellia echini]|uniref:Endonuclease/exonuclease/phosphatase family protein n=1 Tax=Colwellia echini TaxID=1982103 RepID=A0ABY3MT45_9GAMM|nr:endonuclease/exonuclease/phosphatase family protein [Colwellia echini]
MATFNLFNYLEPPNACYEFERIYSAEQWHKKQNWIRDYLAEYQPDIIGFQEVFSPDSLKELVAEQGYEHFAVVDEPQVVDDFIYSRPVVGIASRFPIVECEAIKANMALVQTLGLSSDFSFSRKVIRATIDVPHLGKCDCYVVHFKSKRTMIEIDEACLAENGEKLSPEQIIIETLKAQVAGGWGSTIQRGSEAALLMVEMIARREQSNNPMLLMGDFNNTLVDGVLTHLLTNTLRFVSTIDRDAYLAKYCLQDSWDLYQTVKTVKTDYINESQADGCLLAEQQLNEKLTNASDPNQSENVLRNPTHYFGATNSVLDYILLSCDFDASYHDSLYEVSDYHTYDRHLINPIFDRDGESTDHGVVLITLTLRS